MSFWRKRSDYSEAPADDPDEVCIVSEELFAVAISAGVSILNDKSRTAPLTAAQMKNLGITGLPSRWGDRERRPLRFVIFRDQHALDAEGTNYVDLPRPAI